MIDNQAAHQGEGGFLDSLRDAAQRRAPESGSVLDQLRSLGVDPASLTRRPDTPLTSEQRASLQLDNALRMGGQFISDAWAGRRSDIDPYAAVSSIAEAGATKMLGETVGAAVGGVVGEIANLVGFSAYFPNWVSEQAFGMSSGEALDSAFGAVGLEPPTLLRMAVDRNMSSAAFDDSVMENRLRAVDPKASRTEASAAIGEYDPMSAPGIAKAFSTAATQLGTAIGMSMIPGGQAAGAATAARSVGVIGRVLAPARAMLTNPGGKAYLGYMGGRQAIDRGADYRRFFEREQQAANVYNDALDRTGLADILGKHEVPQDSRLEQFGVSVASGLMTAASELIGTGFSVAAGRRIASRLMGRYSERAVEGGMGAVLREAAKKGFTAGGMEGLEEVVDGYGQALIGGIYDWTEEGGWAWSEQTGEPMSFLKVAQNHAPNLMYDFAIAFLVSAPLGAGGGIASVRRRQNLHDAFTMALLRDRMAQAETGANPGEADFLAAQVIAESMATSGGDGAVTQTVLARLREVMPEIGQVTESQLSDPAWVRSFVENFPILAMRLSEMDSLSRANLEWLTGPASRGRVPSSAARGQFLETLRGEMRTLIPAYMQGWFDRSADEIRQYNAQLQQLGNRTDDEARSLRALARSRIHFIQDVRKRVQQAWLNKETIDQSTFQSWLRLSEASEAVDLDGTADAVENSPHTERTAPDDIKSLLDLARQGDNEASFELARRYEAGEGVEQHYYKSQYWLNLALSRLGDVDAMVWMGKYYEGRIQTYPPTANQPRSIDKARALYRRAYEMGSDEAGGLLAELESRGQPTPAVPRPGRVDAARPAQAPQAAPAASAAPQPSVPQESARKPQAAPEGVRTPRAATEAPVAAEAATEAPAASEADPAAATRRAVEERMRVEREAQAEAAAREADAAAAEADAPRAEVERQVQEAVKDDGLRVRFVEAETDVEQKIAKGAAKLGRRVQFITIMRDTPREGMRRRRSWSGIRGFVGKDADTIYLVRLPQVARSDRAATAYYLQTLSHENAHGLIQEADRATIEKVDALLSRELIMEMMAFDVGEGESAREEIRVHTLTLGVNDAAALDAILLADTAASKVKARLKVLFSRVKLALTGNERAALLQKLVRDQVARVKAAEAAKPKPLTAASLNAAVAAGDTVTATTERGGEMREVSYGKDAEFIERKGVLYAKQGKTLDRLDSPAVVPAKPAVGKAKAKKATPKPQAAATPKPEAKVDPANEPVASELPRPKRGRGKRGDGQQAMFMREKRWGMPRMGSAFSGMGTWEIALRGLAEPVRGVEISPNIAVAYALNNGDHVEVADVTKVPSDFAKDMDLFCASPVCKAYSDANRNRGEQGLDIASANWVASVIRDSRPANIAIENVPSYRSSDAYRIIESSLREAGYQFDAVVYDASDFGAATSRKRLIIRATLGTLPAAPSPTHGVSGTPKVGWMEAAGDLMDSLPPAPPIKKGSLVDQWLQEEGGLGSEPLLIMGSPPGRGTRRKGIRTTRKGNEPSPTIKATPKEVIRVWTGSEMKRATPRFLARLHGIPDDVSLPSDEKLAKTVIGNGIPLPLVRAVVGPMVSSGDRVAFMRERTDAIDTAYMKAVERGQSVAARKHLDAAAEAMGFERAFRFIVQTPAGERGLINREAWDDRHLTERQILELPELLDLGMQQPARGTTGTFYFTSDGLKNHAKLIRWLSNAATGEVIRRSVYFNDANWESFDGQVALETGQYVSARLVVRDGDGNVIPPSRRFAGAQNESTNDTRFMRERTEGPVPDGMTRLYRVQPRAEARRRLDPGSWQYQAMESSGTIAAQGRWFTDNPDHASFYVNDIGRENAEIVAVDVPTADLDKYRVSNFRGGEGVVDPRRFSARGMADQEFFLPRDIASQATTTGDIRFMRERVTDVLDSFRDESDSSSRTSRLATELMWKYTVLDRAVKAARRRMKIDPEDAANELFQLAPGIVSRILQDFGNAEQKPFEEAAKALAKRLRLSKDRVLDRIQEHAFYKHALDVMAWVKERDAEEIARRAERQQEMLTDMGVDVDPDAIYDEVLKAMATLGVDENKARSRLAEIEKEFAADPAWMNLSDQLRAMNRKTLEIRRESGQITEAAYQELVKRYPNYVPVVVSIFDESVTGETDEVTRPARRSLRTMRRIGEAKRPIREYWAANWDLTKADRMSAAHTASLMPGDNAMYRLAMMEALKTPGGENLLEVVDMQAMIGTEVRRLKMDLIKERDAAARKARERGEEPAAFEMPSDEVLTERAAQQVRTDLDMDVAGTSTQTPTVRRFKLERDTDMTDPRVYDDIELFARTGLTTAQTEANEQARADGKPLPHTPVKTGTKAHERKMEQLQEKIKIVPKGTVMHYRILDPLLARAMLLNEPTWIEKWRNEGGKVKRTLAMGWLKLMAYQRFAFVTASPGFWKGELFRSPQQAQIMARVMSQEMGLSPEVQEKFLRNVDALNGAPVWPLVGVFGAFKALPGRKPWRSVRHVMRGGDPRNEYEELVRQAMEDGVMQGSLYSVADYESMQADLRDRVRRLTGASGTRMDGVRQKLSNVSDVMKTVTDGIDMITGGLDFVNRMVVYQAALMSGISRQQAAVMARESTVDFSKKGTKTRGLSQMYLFLGPRMQGIHQLLRAFSTGDGTGAARIASSMSMRALMRMFLWSFAFKMLREFFYEDDDEPQSVPSQFASLQNMLVPMFAWNDKKQHMYLEINNPYGFGAIAKLADRIGEFMVGDSTAIEMLAGAVGDFGSELTPLAFDLKRPSSVLQALTPTNLQVGTDLLLNQDWKGSPIYPEGAKFGPGEQRRSQQYFAANTWRTSIWLADVIADLTRPIFQTFGFEGQRGIEISPNQIQYVFQRWMPGFLRQVADGVSWASGQDVTIDRLPIVGSFVTQTGGQSVVSGQWRDMGTIRANMKVDLKEGRESRRQILERYGDVGRWFERGAYDNAERQIKKLQEARNKAMRAGKREIFDRINDRIEAIQTRVLREYARIRERSSGGGIDAMFQRGVLN